MLYYRIQKVTRALEDFEVTETSASHLTRQCPNVKVVIQPVTAHDPQNKVNWCMLKVVSLNSRSDFILSSSHFFFTFIS